MDFQTTQIERGRNSCKLCRGDPLICERVGSECPVRQKLGHLNRIQRVLERSEFFGASPPSVFVGSWNYPKVLAGPLLPPGDSGDTSAYANEHMWMQSTLDEVIRLRMHLLRGKDPIRVTSASDPAGRLARMQEIAMSSIPLDTEMEFERRPNFQIQLLTRAAPSGPSGVISDLDVVDNAKVPRPVDKVVTDTDLKARSATEVLYESKIPDRHIRNVFSMGLLGEKKQRRLVPTQWTITAVDDILSRHLTDEIRHNESVDEFQVLESNAFHNTVITVMAPGGFAFEVLEGWITSDGYFTVVQDHEMYKGRKKYATRVAGAYYATRLAALEYLRSIRRKATVLVFLEVTPGWIPLGVWRFREILRESALQGASTFSSLSEAMMFVETKLNRPLRDWLPTSKLISYLNPRSRLDRFLSNARRGRDAD